jgi:hypothetical protein
MRRLFMNECEKKIKIQKFVCLTNSNVAKRRRRRRRREKKCFMPF